MRIKANLIKVGRNRFSGIVDFYSWNDLIALIGQHLMSKDIEIDANHGSKSGIIYVGGTRRVGMIKLIDGTFVVKQVALNVRAEGIGVKPDGK